MPLLRAALATTFPLLLLGAIGTSLLPSSGDAGGLAGSAIPDRAMHTMGGRYETELLRNLLEAHYFQTGAYPGSLAEMAGVASQASASLTSSRLADYYYVVREAEVILLAPMD
jgi:hypothetical protein